MNIRELIELIHENNDGDFKQTLEDVEEIYLQMKLCSYQIISEFEELALDNNLCPDCCSELQVVDTYEEDRGEFWGEPATETMNILGCPNCGFIVE